MNKKQIILLDFDHTLFNTTAYVQILQKHLQDEGVSKEEFWRKRKLLKECCSLVDIDTFVESISVAKKDTLHNAIHFVIKKYAAQCIFSDVQDFIARHMPNFDIVIVTDGDQELQREKIEHSQLPKEVSYIITRKSKAIAIKESISPYEKLFL